MTKKPLVDPKRLQNRFDELVREMPLKTARNGFPTDATIRKARAKGLEALTDEVLSSLWESVGLIVYADRASFDASIKARFSK